MEYTGDLIVGGGGRGAGGGGRGGGGQQLWNAPAGMHTQF